MRNLLTPVILALGTAAALADSLPSGTGVVLVDRTADDTPLIIKQVFAGSGAEKAGIKPGELLIAIDSTNAIGLHLTNVVALLRGPTGTTIKISTADPHRKTTNHFTITRGPIRPPARGEFE